MLKTLSLYNLCDIGYMGDMEFKGELNAYRCSIETSIQCSSNKVLVYLLSNDATEEEFYEAYRVASSIKDEQLKKKIIGEYEKRIPMSNNTLADKVYLHLNAKHLQRGEPSDTETIASSVVSYVRSYMLAEYLDTTFDALSDLMACISFIQYADIHSEDELLKDLHDYYIEENNERIMLFEPEISFEYYCRIIKMLREHLEITAINDLFRKLANEQAELYSGLSYDVTTAKNFTMYVVALSFSDISVGKDHLLLMKNIYQQIYAETSMTDYSSIFYLNIAGRYLGMEPIQVPVNEEIKSVYYLWVTGQKAGFHELYSEGSEIVETLMVCDASFESKQRNDILNEIDIFSYVDEEGFSHILNLYVCIMSNSGLLSSEIRTDISEYIQNAECDFGYRENSGGYDFRASVYFTNIKYILEGGTDIGLR